MIRKNLIKSLSLIMATMLAVMTVACGQNTVTDNTAAVETSVDAEDSQEKALEDAVTTNSLLGSVANESGKVETVYVTADANGAVNDVIVSEWLKNAEASSELSDKTDLKNIVNVKGDETYTDNGDGTVTWEAGGSDIYYQGTTDKELPVKMNITYTLDGKEISPEELAGKSGKVTIRFDYENNAKQSVDVDGKEYDVYTPFAMVSGMMLDADKFTNVEISNGKVISDGGKYIVMGVAVPGLKESLDISDEKWDELEDGDEIKDKLSNSFEITADTSDFELGMTITMASSDILSDFGVTDLNDSEKIEDLKDDMNELYDGANKLVDGSKALKDGTAELKDGTGNLADGTQELYNGTSDLYDGTSKLYDGTGSLYDGTAKLYDGTGSLVDGAGKLYDGSKALGDGAGKLSDGSNALGKGAKDLATGVKSYTDGATQIKDGAGQLKTGVASAQAGSKKLVAGVTSAESSSKTLADGAKQVDEGVNKMQAMMKNMVEDELVKKLDAIKANQALYDAAYTWLTNTTDTTSEPSAAVLQVLQSIDEGIKSGDDAVKIKKAALAALGGQATISLSVINTYEMLVTTVKTGTLYAEDNEDVTVTPSDAQPASGADAQTPADTGADGETPAGNGEPGAASDGQGEAGASQATGSGSENGGSETGTGNGAATPAANGGNQTGTGSDGLDENGAAGGEDGSVEGTGAEDGSVEGTGAEDGEPTEELSITGNEKKTTLVGNSGNESGYSDDDVRSIANFVKRYSILCGATSSAEKTLGSTYDQISAMKTGLEQQLPGIAKLAAGADEVAAGTNKLNAGLGQLKDGQIQLDDGITLVGNGVDTLYSGANTLTSNNAALVGGSKQLADGAAQITDGANQLKSGAGQLKDGAGQLKDGAGQLKDGAGQLKDGAAELKNGAGQLLDGTGKLKDGAKELNDGAKALDEGAAKLDDGVQELMDGMIKFDEEGIRKLYDAFDGDLTDFANRLNAIQKAGSSYNSFGGSDEDVDSSVKFVIKTGAVKSL